MDNRNTSSNRNNRGSGNYSDRSRRSSSDYSRCDSHGSSDSSYSRSVRDGHGHREARVAHGTRGHGTSRESYDDVRAARVARDTRAARSGVDRYSRSDYGRSGSSDGRGYSREAYGRSSRADSSYRSRSESARSDRSDRADRSARRDSQDFRSSDARNSQDFRSAGTRSERDHRSSDNRVSRAEYTQQRAARQGKRKKTVIAVVVILALVAVVGGGAAFAWVSKIQSNMQGGVDDDLRNALVKTDMTKEPFYMLLLGTDKSEFRASGGEGEDYGDCYRSDSMMLCRVDPIETKVTLISLRRDTCIPAMGENGEYGMQKLNAAYAFGGPSLAVKEVSKLAGVPISHYAEINFDGFCDIVDTIGGIEIDVPERIDDPDAGSRVLEPGLQTLDGEGALVFSRSRNAFYEYGDGDAYRSAHQRQVVGAILKKVLSSDIATIASSVSTLSQYITTDLGVMDIIGLAQAFKGLDPETGIYTAAQPAESRYVNELWFDYTIEPDWTNMMERVKQGLPPTEGDVVTESGTVIASTGGTGAAQPIGKNLTVSIRNGTKTDGLAADAQTKLEAEEFTCNTGNANEKNYLTTLIIYNDDRYAEKAQAIADLLGIGRVVKDNNEYIFDTNFLVVIGADWGPGSSSDSGSGSST